MRSLFALALLALLVAPSSARAISSRNDAMAVDPESTLEWQKSNLEDRLQDRLQKAIAPAVPEKSFVVSVTIELKKKADPAPSATAKPADAAKVVDDRVPLGKLDLDAPTIDESQDEDNLFKNISKVSVNVLLDKNVPDGKKDVVMTIAKDSLGQIGDSAPEIKIDKVDMAVTPVPEKWDLKQWALEFRTPLGILAGAVVFSFFLFFMTIIVFGGYRKLESRRLSILEAQNSREEAAAQAAKEQAEGSKEEDLKVDPESEEGEGSDVAVHVEGMQGGFEKFRNLMKESPERAAALVKQWVKAPVTGAAEALVMLPQMLSTEELLTVFKFLSLDDRKEWRKHLSKPITQETARVSDLFVSSQIVESLLVPAPKVGDEIREMLGDLKLSECVELANQDTSLGALLLNLLPTSQVARMLVLMPAELANTVTVGSLKFSDEEIQSKSAALKEAISGVRAKAKAASVPFVDRASELLREVGPDKEASIFGALAESGEYAVLEAAARQFFPAELLMKLPGSIIKACLDRMPLSKRADLISTRADEEKTLLLDAIGKAGSKVRDVIDVELNEVTSDEIRKKRIEKNKDAIWGEFIALARTLLRGSQSAVEQAEPVLNAWLSEKSNGQIGGSGDQPSAAA